MTKIKIFTVFGSKFSGLSHGIDDISEFLVICQQKGVIRGVPVLAITSIFEAFLVKKVRKMCFE